MAIATYSYDTIPAPERAAVPPVEVITQAFGSTTDPAAPPRGGRYQVPPRASPNEKKGQSVLVDLDGGTGFDRGFLTEAVHPPGCDPAELLVVDGQVELRYMHFSVAMHAHRRLARWVAWNIDGLTRWDGDDIPRDGMQFVPDPRVPAAAQTTEAVYTRNRLDRGHLARRADLLWGTRAEAQVANRHSFYFTNITPQMDNFNQSGQNGIWGRLENAVLAATGSARVSVRIRSISPARRPVVHQAAGHATTLMH